MKLNRQWIFAVIAAACVLAAGCGREAAVQQTAAAASPSAENAAAEKQQAENAEAANQPEESAAAEAGNQSAENAVEAKRTADTSEEAAGQKEYSGQVAGENETIPQDEVVTADMTPVYADELKDGSYDVKADSSSSMFRITECKLIVENNTMRAVMTMSGTSYIKLYMGTGREAVAADETEYIPYAETESGAYTFEIPVKALDAGIDCSAFSKNKEKWYDRVLVFRADSLPADAFAVEKLVTAESLQLADGIYTAEVVLEGGSGRAAVESPAQLRIEDGNIFAVIVWGSANYDYMKVNDEIYEWSGEEEHSTFEIPVAGFDWSIPVIADTVAMSVPHEIEYTLTFDSASLKRVN